MTAIVLRGEARSLPLPDASVDLVCTSPPYFGQRDYRDGSESLAGQIGSEETPAEFIAALLDCTAEWARVLKPGGSMFVNLGDSYYSGKGAPGKTTTDPKNAGRNARRTTRSPLDYGLDLPRKTLMGLPWRYALDCMDELGLILRRDIIWHKTSAQPESVADRCATRHEYLFHLVKQPRYFTAADEIREPHTAPGRQAGANAFRARDANLKRSATGDYEGQNPLGKLPGSVWEIAATPLVVPPRIAHARCCHGFPKPGCEGLAHHAAFPLDLPRRCILGWSPPGICTECGEGRRPVSVGERMNTRPLIPLPAHLAAHGQDGRAFSRGITTRVILGYACACPDASAPTRPAVVVDPFGGTGTTALVADALGRTGITFDLSGGYCDLAVWRTRDPGERARALGMPKPPPVPEGQRSLFDEEAS